MNLKRFRTVVAMPEVRDKKGNLIRLARNEDIEIVIDLDTLTNKFGQIAVRNKSGRTVLGSGAVIVKQIL